MGGISDRKTHFDRHILRYEPYNPLQVQRSIVLSNEEGPKPHSLWLSQLVLLALRPARGSPARGGGVSPRGVRVGPKDCASAELARQRARVIALNAQIERQRAEREG